MGAIILFRILFGCAGGFSSSLLVSKVTKAAASRGIEVEAEFIGAGASHFQTVAVRADVVMFGPQVRMFIQKQTEFLLEKSIPWAIMDSLAYGRCDGDKILDQALALVPQPQK